MVDAVWTNRCGVKYTAEDKMHRRKVRCLFDGKSIQWYYFGAILQSRPAASEYTKYD